MADDASDSPQSIPVSGSGTPTAPAASVSPSSLAFGAQRVDTASTAQTATVRNTGTAGLHVSSIALGGANPADFAVSDDCPATLAPSDSCTITARFAPGTAGVRTASVVVTDDAADSPQSLALTGTGTAPAAALSPSSLAFGSVLVGSASSARTVTIAQHRHRPAGLRRRAVHDLRQRGEPTSRRPATAARPSP